MRITMPESGRPREQVLADLREMKSDDTDWQHGRAPLYVFKADDEVHDIGREAFFEYFTENALGARRAFPSVKRMEEEVVAMALSLFDAPDGAEGFMSTGGTESIILAVQACRDWTRAKRGEPRFRGAIVAAESVHPAFDKAAKLMDLEVRRAPVGPDLRADPAAVAALIDDEAMMIVGSAPSFPYGVIDPIAELGAVAHAHDLWLHVDACVGGYLAPFARRAGWDIPAFDFGVPEVASMSADLHKFGFCPKPASTVFFRDAERAGFAPFDFSGWPNGRFLTNTLVGTRPAGGVAAAWAVFNHLGIAGYTEVARKLMTFVDAYKAGVEAIPGLHVHGAPHLSIVSFGSDQVDVFKVAELMHARGWLPGLTQKPRGIHRMMSMIHAISVDEYLEDLRAAVGTVRQSGGDESKLLATY